MKKGKVNFDEEVVGKDLYEQYGINRDFKIFRYAYKEDADSAKALFKVKFQLSNMSVEKNKKFSAIPMRFLIRFKGFESKYWLCNAKTNECMGVYRWKTIEDAKRYSGSIAMRFMTMRSVKGSVSYEIKEL